MRGALSILNLVVFASSVPTGAFGAQLPELIPRAPEDDVLPADEVQGLRRAIAKLRRERIRADLASLKRHRPPPLEAIAQPEKESRELADAVRRPAPPVPIEEKLAVITRAHGGARDTWGENCLSVNGRTPVRPLRGSLRVAKGDAGSLAVVRYARVFWNEEALTGPARGAVSLISVEQVPEEAIRNVASEKKLDVRGIEGVLYPAYPGDWRVLPEDASRSGPFYEVVGATEKVGDLRRQSYRWLELQVLVLESHKPPLRGSHTLFLLSAKVGDAEGHEGSLERAKDLSRIGGGLGSGRRS